MASNNNAFEDFKEVHNNYFCNQGNQYKTEPELSVLVDSLIKSGKKYESVDPYSSSCFYCLASYACIFYLYRYDINCVYAAQKGSIAIKQAVLLCQNEVYDFLSLLYGVTKLPDDPKCAFGELERIHKLCPSFRLMEDHIVNTTHLGEVYGAMMGYYLSRVTELLMENKDYFTLENACLLLQQFPGEENKLRAFDYLCIIYTHFGKDEEALRYAKLGVELLGSNINYDYNNPVHQFWGSCWWHVAEINRRKKNYDFAMSLFEKGTALGIVDCVRSLGAMYENGESEDTDFDKAKTLYRQADDLVKERERLAQEEAERLRLEREKEIELENQRIQEENRLARLAEEISNRKLHLCFYYVAIIVLGFFVFYETSSIRHTTIIDVAKTCIDSGSQVLLLNEYPNSPYMIFKEGKNVVLFKNDKKKTLLTFDSEIQVADIELNTAASGGLFVKWNYQTKVIAEWEDISVYESVPGSSFVIWDKSISNNQVRVGTCYFVDSKTDLFVQLNNASFNRYNGLRSVSVDVKGNLLEMNCRDYFLNRWNTSTLRRYKSYFEFKTTVSLSYGSFSLPDKIDFPRFECSLYANNIGTMDQLRNMEEDFGDIINNRLTSTQISKLFNVSYKLNRHHGYDNRYTFVIKSLENKTEKEKVGLYCVDNYNKKYRLITTALEASFQSNQIKVVKYDTFLLFFDSTETVYYNYYGQKIR